MVFGLCPKQDNSCNSIRGCPKQGLKLVLNRTCMVITIVVIKYDVYSIKLVSETL